MQKKSGSGSEMFLMEMIVVVFFFSICVSVCVLAFVKSNNKSRLAADTNHAVLAASNICECLKKGNVDEMQKEMNAVEVTSESSDEKTYRVFWNKNWENTTDVSEDNYYAEISIDKKDGLQNAAVKVFHNTTELYSVESKTYLGNQW